MALMSTKEKCTGKINLLQIKKYLKNCNFFYHLRTF